MSKLPDREKYEMQAVLSLEIADKVYAIIIQETLTRPILANYPVEAWAAIIVATIDKLAVAFNYYPDENAKEIFLTTISRNAMKNLE